MKKLFIVPKMWKHVETCVICVVHVYDLLFILKLWVKNTMIYCLKFKAVGKNLLVSILCVFEYISKLRESCVYLSMTSEIVRLIHNS